MMTKADQQVEHCKKRFLERFGVRLTPRLRQELITQITTGKAAFVEKQSNRVSVFKVAFTPQPSECSGIDPKAMVVQVIYDSNTKNIVTALRDGMKIEFWG